MGLGDFLRALLGGQPPGAGRGTGGIQADLKHATSGAASQRHVAVMAGDSELRARLSQDLRMLVEEAGYQYADAPSANAAIGAQVLILDATPASDAKHHGEYDKIIRIKKARGKTGDMICMIGPRENFKKFPRGTYPGLLYFCLEGNDFDLRHRDLTIEGQPTVAGPTLFNFPDLPVVVKERLLSANVARKAR